MSSRQSAWAGDTCPLPLEVTQDGVPRDGPQEMVGELVPYLLGGTVPPSPAISPLRYGMWESRRGNLGPQWDHLSKAGPWLGLENVTKSLLDRMPHLEGLLQHRFQGYIATKCRTWWLSWWLCILRAECWTLNIGRLSGVTGCACCLCWDDLYGDSGPPSYSPEAIILQPLATVSPEETRDGKEYLSSSHQTAAIPHGDPWRNSGKRIPSL